MANREELGIIRGARAGRVADQLELGRRYLFGSAGLPKSLATALHWLERAASQHCPQAWQLIGAHIPHELAVRSARPVLGWYERAFDDGVVRAGLVLAQLVLGNAQANPRQRAKALLALEAAARAGLPEAQWLLAQQRQAGSGASRAPAPLPAGPAPSCAPDQLALADQAWRAGDLESFVHRALPLARMLAVRAAAGQQGLGLGPDDAGLLARVAEALEGGRVAHSVGTEEVQGFWQLAASAGDKRAQLAVGLWCARMRLDGSRLALGHGAANFKRAIRWLAQAGEQGLAEAWFALSRIYVKPEFSQRNVADAQKYLERAAEMGYRDAQLDCGNHYWRARREHEDNDVRALYWWQQAAAQGCLQSAAALRKLATRLPSELPLPPHSTPPRARSLTSVQPLLAARVELAQVFGLSRPEALLLDVRAADRGHCLVIDIRGSYRRSKRRLVMVETAAERQLLDRVARLFEGVDPGPCGPEGNYRQRLYRLKTWLGAEAVGDELQLAA
ncbi:tetratricopeptide repeat protein [Massilia sp. TS11]|uniref:tetratricopeptide repeat protein n=1 Tax=Massilia sp. TS11 TaxID=2908003 RepID=UPI001EDB743C|nr:tetratricopeptide repeat protein [Massilia sp. TS11]MCG2585880.1 sel1 repeat family protein [Massilia sp. TS11]